MWCCCGCIIYVFITVSGDARQYLYSHEFARPFTPTHQIMMIYRCCSATDTDIVIALNASYLSNQTDRWYERRINSLWFLHSLQIHRCVPSATLYRSCQADATSLYPCPRSQLHVVRAHLLQRPKRCQHAHLAQSGFSQYYRHDVLRMECWTANNYFEFFHFTAELFKLNAIAIDCEWKRKCVFDSFVFRVIKVTKGHGADVDARDRQEIQPKSDLQDGRYVVLIPPSSSFIDFIITTHFS